MQRQKWVTLCLLVVFLATPLIGAQKKGKSKNSKPAPRRSSKAGKRALMAVTPERQAHVMAFVKQHHPELTDLLLSLEKQNKRAYQRAIRDLFRTSERLINIREKFPQRYGLELKIWKAKSRSALLATQYKQTKDSKVRDQLREVVNVQIDLQLELLDRDRQRHQERLDRVKKQIADLEKSRKKTVDRQLRLLTQQKRPIRKPAAGGKKTSAVSTNKDAKKKAAAGNKSTQRKPGKRSPKTPGQ